MFDADETICASWNARHAGKEVGKKERGNVRIDGKDINLRRLDRELGEAIDAIASSSSGMPLNEETGGFAGDSGKLATVIRAATRSRGLMLDDFTVLGRARDPYRLDTPKGHREGQWFADQLDELFPDTVVHLRGLHYVLVSKGGVMKPDGKPYRNTAGDFKWLCEASAKAARWLGKVSFERIIDQRNDDPIEHRGARSAIPTPGASVSVLLFGGDRDSGFDVVIGTPVVSLALGDEASVFSTACEPYPSLWGLDVEQPYCFAFFGEKSSLREVLEPIARQYGANMYLCSGEISDTLVYHMARDADADGRPLVVFTFSDFDPAGHQMPISIGRKLQALRDLEFPGLRAEVEPVSLTLEQVIAERLPTTMVKAKENRRDKWDEAFGPALREAGLVTGREPAQVEIDALAAIRPDVLRRITHEKIALYRDETIERRVRTARDRWWRMARSFLAPQVEAHQSRLDEIKRAAEEAAEQFNEARQSLADAVSEAKEVFEEAVSEAQEAFEEAIAQPKEDLDEAKDRMSEIEDDLELVVEQIRPPEPPEQLEAEIDLDRQAPIVRLDWGFEDATMALKSHKAYENGDDDDAESSP